MATAMRPASLIRPVTVALSVVCAALALVTAPAAALVSRMCWRTGTVTVPYGLLLSAAASMGVVLLARAVARPTGFLAMAAWLIGLGIVVKGTSGGGFLVADDAFGWAFLVLDTVAVMGAAFIGGNRA